MTFQFGFNDEDIANADSLVAAEPSSTVEYTRPVKEHDIGDLVGKICPCLSHSRSGWTSILCSVSFGYRPHYILQREPCINGLS